jgi:AraC family transcriptional regulator
MKAALQDYHARMQRVLDYIDRHLDDDLDLEKLSGVAAFSKFHFHRQFTATFGLSVHRYVQLARLKRASHRLAYTDAESVTDIAMEAGYDAPDAFARAFRQRFGQTPSSFRKSPDWEPWLAAFGPLDNARSKLMQKTFTTGDVTIREVPPTPGGDHGASGRPGDARRHHPAVHRLAQGRWPAPQDESDFHDLAFRATSCIARRL